MLDKIFIYGNICNWENSVRRKKMKNKKVYKAPKIRSEKIQVGVFGEYVPAIKGDTKFLQHDNPRQLCI
jgi:hypothetical protein